MPEICLMAPAGECIDVAEARSDRHLDDHADDAKLRASIAAARQAAESKTRQQLLHARWKLVLDGFPCGPLPLPHSPLVTLESIRYMDMSGAWQPATLTDFVVSPTMPARVSPAFGKIWPIPLPQAASVEVTYTAGYASPITTGGSLASNQFRVSGPVAWAVGDRVNFYNSGGVLPAPLYEDQTYLIETAASGVYTLTDEAGVPVVFSQSGTGRNFIGVVPEGIRAWMLLRIGALFENREEVAVGTRIVVLELPFVDGLLDPYMTGY